jgi:cytochrome c oxidase cbb3-type subunit 1
MASPSSQTSSAGVEGASVDASVRLPGLYFAAAAAVWLVVGTALSVIAAFKLHSPAFLADCEWLTYGRVRAAESAVLTYGWGFNAAFAIVIWLMARLAQAEVRRPVTLVVSGVFWNLGVLLGSVGILGGHGTAVEGLEFPAYVNVILFAAYAWIAIWALLTFRARRSPHVFISQWYLVLALLWFPWVFSLAHLLLVVDPVKGVMQPLVQTWYAHSLFLFWFGGVGVAALYYMAAKLTGRSIAHYHLSTLGFWLLVIFGAWAGPARLVGAPVPAWVVSLGIAMSMVLLVVVCVWAFNLVPTLARAAAVVRQEASYRFVAVGVVALLVAQVASLLLSFRGVAELLQFTFVQSALTQLNHYGFFSMVAFGTLYVMVPRITGRSWPVPSLVGFHFWSSLLGCLASVVALSIAGYKQGVGLNRLPMGDGAVPTPLIDVLQSIQPYLFTQTSAMVLLVAGHVAFLVNLGWMAAGCCSSCLPAPSSLPNASKAA